MNEGIKSAEQTSSQQELHRLLVWIKDHPKDWDYLCNPDGYEKKIDYLTDLIDRLYQADLYTMLFLVLYSNFFVAGIDRAVTVTTNECFLDIPAGVLMERFHRNLKAQAAG